MDLSALLRSDLARPEVLSGSWVRLTIQWGPRVGTAGRLEPQNLPISAIFVGIFARPDGRITSHLVGIFGRPLPTINRGPE